MRIRSKLLGSVLLAVACRAAEPGAPAASPPAAPPRARPAGPAQSSPPAAFGLTSSDGEGLAFVKLAVSGFVQRPLAFTELHMVFENPADRAKEGRFRIALPRNGAVARFAMLQDGRWQEGEMLERRTAQRVYDDFLHRRQDPALLEQESPEEFSARVFPIPAHGRKELILSYTQELREAEAYRVPLRGLLGLAEYSARVLVRGPAGSQVLEEARTSWAPDADLVVERRGESPAALRSGRQVVARAQVPGNTEETAIDSLALLVDTSASRAAGFGRQTDLVQALAAALPPSTPLLVASFDQDVEAVFDGKAGEFRADSLRARKALGATDLGRAFEWLAARLAKSPRTRVAIVGDGVVTAGPEGDDLAKAAALLAKAGVRRLDAVAVGGIRDDAAMARLVRSGFPQQGIVVRGELAPTEILRRLRTDTLSGLKVELAGGAWVQPAVLDGVQPGDEVLVHGEVPQERDIEVRIGGKTVLNAKGETALVARACAAAKIGSLLAAVSELPAGRTTRLTEIREEIVALSTGQRVSSPLTAFLVLETDEDYARYGIDRASVGDIWTVGTAGLVAVRRGSGAPSPPTERAPGPRAVRSMEGPSDIRDERVQRLSAAEPKRHPVVAKEEASREDRVAAGPQPVLHALRYVDAPPRTIIAAMPVDAPLDHSGAAMMAPGVPRASAKGFSDVGGPDAKAAEVAAGNSDLAAGARPGGNAMLAERARRFAPQISIDDDFAVGTSGSDTETIGRLVRMRTKAVQQCYERALRRNPTLGGRIVVRFVVTTRSRVGEVAIVQDAVGDGTVAACMRSTIQRWTFPFRPQEDTAVTFPSFGPRQAPRRSRTAVPARWPLRSVATRMRCGTTFLPRTKISGSSLWTSTARCAGTGSCRISTLERARCCGVSARPIDRALLHRSASRCAWA